MGQHHSRSGRPEVSSTFQLDVIFDDVSAAMQAGCWVDIDRALDSIDVAGTSLTILIGWLSVTAPGRAELKNRAAFFLAVKDCLQIISPDNYKAILRGLE